MISLIKFKISVFLSLAILLVACTSKKAKDFEKALDVQERKVTHMLIGKNASESLKLDYLIADNFDQALAVVEKQEQEFNEIIKAIKDLDGRNLNKAAELKKAKIDYYESLKVLHTYAKKEIEQQKLIHNTKGKERSHAQDRLIELMKAKQALYEQVYQADERLYNVLVEFEQANGL